MVQFDGPSLRNTLGALALSAGLSAAPAPAADNGLSGTLPPVPPESRQSSTNSASAITAIDALNYLSGRFGFIVVGGPALPERITFPTNAPMTKAEAVERLNLELAKRELYAAQDGRFLAILSLADAAFYNQPVRVGRDPERVRPGPSIATHIIPLAYVTSSELKQNLAMLLPQGTSISAHDDANSLIVSGTESAIHRALLLSDALDRVRIAGSSIKVVGLRFADAKGFASVVKELFGGSSGQSGAIDPAALQSNAQNPFAQIAAAFQQQQAAEVPQSMPPIVAVADEHSNSLVLRGSPGLFPVIDSLTAKLDINVRGATEIRLVRLKNADATETAELISNVFSNPELLESQDAGTGQRRREQDQVIAVPDQRTSSVLVRASAQTFPEILKLVRALDADPSGKQRIAVINVNHGDPSVIANVLQSLFGTSGSTTTIQQSALEARSQQFSQSSIAAGSGVSLGSSGSGRTR